MSSSEPKHLYPEPQELPQDIIDQLIDEEKALAMAQAGHVEFFDAITKVIKSGELTDASGVDYFYSLMLKVAIIRSSQHIAVASDLVEECQYFMGAVIARMIKNNRDNVLGVGYEEN